MNQKKFGVRPIKPTRFPFIENQVLKVIFYVVLFLAVALICVVLGAMVGFSVLGDGEMLDVLKWETWQHILDFLK